MTRTTAPETFSLEEDQFKCFALRHFFSQNAAKKNTSELPLDTGFWQGLLTPTKGGESEKTSQIFGLVAASSQVNGLASSGQLKLREHRPPPQCLALFQAERTCFQKSRVTSFPGGAHLTCSQIRYEEHPCS